MPSPSLLLAVLPSMTLPEPAPPWSLTSMPTLLTLAVLPTMTLLSDSDAQRDAGAGRLAGVVRLDAVVARADQLDAARVERDVVLLDQAVVGVVEVDAAGRGVDGVADDLVAVRLADLDALALQRVALDEVVGRRPRRRRPAPGTIGGSDGTTAMTCIGVARTRRRCRCRTARCAGRGCRPRRRAARRRRSTR